MDGGGAVGDGEVRSSLAGLGRMRAAVAAGREGQRHKQSEREEPREPHIPIIRSERAQRKGGGRMEKKLEIGAVGKAGFKPVLGLSDDAGELPLPLGSGSGNGLSTSPSRRS